jgi:hypothetical protein
VAETEKKKKVGCGNHSPMEESGSQKNEESKHLTILSSMCSLISVARFKDIVRGIGQQTARKCEELVKDMEELNKLRPSWQRYRELSAQAESKERSVKIGYALMLNAPTQAKADVCAYTKSIDQAFGAFSDADLTLSETDIDLLKMSLWRVIREVVRQVVEIRVFELEEYLNTFGLKASRPAIESALATHPKEFKITKRGREKFVSLKGA